jgi:hypothetical protein
MALGSNVLSRVMIEIGARDAGAKAGLDAASESVKKFAGDISQIGEALSSAGKAVLGFIQQSVLDFAKAGDAIDKASLRTGIAADQLSTLGFVAERSGADIKAVEIGVRNMGRVMTEAASGSKMFAEVFDNLGLSMNELSKQSVADRMQTIGIAIANLEDPALQAAYAMRIFGRSGTMLIPMFKEWRANGGALNDRVRELGGVITPEMAANGAALVDGMTDLAYAVKGVANVIGNALAPVVEIVVKHLASLIGAVTKFVDRNRWIVGATAVAGAALLAFGTVVSAVATAIIFSGTSVSTFLTATLIPAFGAAIAAMAPFVIPVIAATIALAALAYVVSGIFVGFDKTNAAIASLVDRMLALFGSTMRVKDAWVALQSLLVNTRAGDALLSAGMQAEILEEQQAEVDRRQIEAARGGKSLTQAEVDQINDEVARNVIEKYAALPEPAALSAQASALSAGINGKSKSLMDMMRGVGTQPPAATPEQVTGTFSARGAAGMFGGGHIGDVMQKQLSVQERTATAVESILENVMGGGGFD